MTESYTEYGVFVRHGSDQLLYRTFRKAEMLEVWRECIPEDIAAKISSVRTRQVSIQHGEWTETLS